MITGSSSSGILVRAPKFEPSWGGFFVVAHSDNSKVGGLLSVLTIGMVLMATAGPPYRGVPPNSGLACETHMCKESTVRLTTSGRRAQPSAML